MVLLSGNIKVVIGNDLSLTRGGVRSFNSDNLNGRKTEEHFNVFLGFKNKICCNLFIRTDGLRSEINPGQFLKLFRRHKEDKVEWIKKIDLGFMMA